VHLCTTLYNTYKEVLGIVALTLPVQLCIVALTLPFFCHLRLVSVYHLWMLIAQTYLVVTPCQLNLFILHLSNLLLKMQGDGSLGVFCPHPSKNTDTQQKTSKHT